MPFTRALIPCLALIGTGTAQQPPLPAITEAKELHRLTRAEMLQPRHVRIKGVLTYKRGDEFNDFAIQDQTGGFIADVQAPIPLTQSLQPGQEIEIEGYTVIEPPPAPRISITSLNPGPIVGLPSPVSLTPQALLGGAGLFSYVEFTGVIRSTRIEKDLNPHRLILDFGPPDQRLSARIARFDDKTIARLKPDARVRVRGTALAWTSVNLQPYSIFIGVHDASQIEILSEAREPSETGTVSLGRLVSSHPEGFDARRERVRGTVTLNWPGEMVIIQGEGGAIRTLPSEASQVQPGDEIDVTGFPSADNGRIILDEAVFGNPLPHRLPPPEKVAAGTLTIEASTIDREAHRILISGTLREIGRRDNHPLLRMETEGKTFDAILPDHEKIPGDLRPGAALELTGICHFIVGKNARRFAIRLDGFELQLSSLADIKILSAPPWWTPQRLAVTIAIVLFVLGLSLLWVIALRRRVAIRSAMLVREIRDRHNRDLLSEERNRLAADLHDTLSQTLSGASLQMEIADSLAGSPGAATHRHLARQLLDRSREDLRRAVWDLSPSALDRKNLAAALRSLADETNASGDTAVTLSIGPDIPRLPDRTHTHLLRVAQEAIHNALRHGPATRIDATFGKNETSLVLEIRDNGGGFDPAQAKGPVEGHFGLASMRNRIQRLGGTFTLHSSPRGTTVTATVTLQHDGDHRSPHPATAPRQNPLP